MSLNIHVVNVFSDSDLLPKIRWLPTLFAVQLVLKINLVDQSIRVRGLSRLGHH